MNTVGVFAASLAAASVAVLATANANANANAVHRSASHTPSSSNHGSGSSGKKGATGSAEDKFAPRFDGLRFIETLVTAHR